MDKYQKLQRIGEGTYGVVYKAKHREHGTILALKRIRLESEDEGERRTLTASSPLYVRWHGQLSKTLAPSGVTARSAMSSSQSHVASPPSFDMVAVFPSLSPLGTRKWFSQTHNQ